MPAPSDPSTLADFRAALPRLLQMSGPQTPAGPDAYRMEECLGSGASGSVFSAVETTTGRPVAIKILHQLRGAGAGNGESFLTWRLQREAQAVAHLDHPGIVRLLHADFPEDGPPRLIMEKVAGPSLAVWSQDKSRQDRLKLFVRLCDAMAYAHQRGVIHRDLKPSNILVDSSGPVPQPRVVDFGLARFMEDSGLHATLTQEGQALGTPVFMSPEQARGESVRVDVRMDVYALGVILFFLVLEPPVLTQNQSSPPTTAPPSSRLRPGPDGTLPAPRQIDPDLDKDLDAILCKAMAHRPDNRYAGVAALAYDLRAYLENRPVSARQGSRWYVFRKHLRRNWRGAALITSALLAAGVAGAWHLREIARRNAIATAAYSEARSLLEFQVTEAADWMRDAGRHDVVAELADRALRFPWELPVPPAENGTSAGRSSEEIRSIIAAMQAEAYERGDDPATALKWREQALAHARNHAASAPGNPAAAWTVLRQEAGVLTNQFHLDTSRKTRPAADHVPAITAWLDRAREAAHRTPGLTVSWIASATSLLVHTAPAFQENPGALPPLTDPILNAHKSLPHAEKLYVSMASAVPQLHRAAALASLAANDLVNASVSVEAAIAAWKTALLRFPRHVDSNTALLRCYVLQCDIARLLLQPRAALAAWKNARSLLKTLDENFLFSGGSAEMEALFHSAIPLAAALQVSRLHKESLALLNDQVVPLFDSMSPFIPAERKKLDDQNKIPDLWPLLAEGQTLMGRAYLALGEKRPAFHQFTCASTTLKDLARWYPQDPHWPCLRAESLIKLLAMPFPEGTPSTPPELRKVILKILDDAASRPPGPTTAETIARLRAAVNQ